VDGDDVLLTTLSRWFGLDMQDSEGEFDQDDLGDQYPVMQGTD
jgi:hypothetical protein